MIRFSPSHGGVRLGLGLVCLGAAVFLSQFAARLSGFDMVHYKPASWLISDLHDHDWQAARELLNRLERNDLSAESIDGIVAFIAADLQHDRWPGWSQRTQLHLSLGAAGLLSAEDYETLALAPAPVEIHIKMPDAATAGHSVRFDSQTIFAARDVGLDFAVLRSVAIDGGSVTMTQNPEDQSWGGTGGSLVIDAPQGERILTFSYEMIYGSGQTTLYAISGDPEEIEPWPDVYHRWSRQVQRPIIVTAPNGR